MERRFVASESVTEGHPDKVCDSISDAVLDAILTDDKRGRVACETFASLGLVIVGGEITTTTYVDLHSLVRKIVREIGYTESWLGFTADTVGVLNAIGRQSPDIAQGVNTGGAGDQGMMFGYANNDTPELMPLPISLAHQLTRQLTKIRKEGKVDFLRPDGKSQVTIEYDGRTPKRIEAVVISTQHSEDVSRADLEKAVKDMVIFPILPAQYVDENTKIFINPTGRFVVGGPQGDSGLTGRKIIVDTYGGYARHGGGAFSGKDPTKVDRSAAYYARYIAKNIVAAGIADECEIQFAYAIGVAHPVSVMIDTFGTGKISDEAITELVKKHFDLRPAAIIRDLDLRRPIYKQTASYGHFGRTDGEFPWEKTDKAEALKADANI